MGGERGGEEGGGRRATGLWETSSTSACWALDSIMQTAEQAGPALTSPLPRSSSMVCGAGQAGWDQQSAYGAVWHKASLIHTCVASQAVAECAANSARNWQCHQAAQRACSASATPRVSGSFTFSIMALQVGCAGGWPLLHALVHSNRLH